MYHLNNSSLKVLERSLHFKKSEALMISIYVLMEVACSYESLHPSNLAIKGGLNSLIQSLPIFHLKEDEVQYFNLFCRVKLLLALLDMEDVILQSMIFAAQVIHGSVHLYHDAILAFILIVGWSCCLIVQDDEHRVECEGNNLVKYCNGSSSQFY